VLQSVSVVPVGLSNHRQGLAELRLFTRDEARQTLALIDAVHGEMEAQHGDGFVYPSDEFYLLAQSPIPDSDYYHGFPQIENGVGMMADFKTSLTEALANLKTLKTRNQPKKIGLITGTAAATYLDELATAITAAVPGLTLTVFPITNHFFGEAITVSGLVTGTDILAQLKNQLADDPCDLLLLPENALRSGSHTLLDDWTLESLSDALGVKVASVPLDGQALLDHCTT
jgi:NifB/MoaA-like Fe-S oxidoreductase